MPQKKNPDVLEIMRARVGVVLGNLSSSFVIQKSLPLTYNRDLQELSPLLRDSLFIVNSSLMILRKIIPSIKVNTLQLTKVGEERFINATNVADLLVKKTGMSFRNSHKIVGRAVQLAIINKSQLNLDILNKASQEIDNSIIDINETEIDSALTSRISVESMKGAGSPASSNVKSMIKSRKKTIKNEILLLNKRLNKILNSKKRLHEKVDGLLGV
jgi:argininosuccinate lyase